MEHISINIVNGHEAVLKNALKNPRFPINQFRDDQGYTMVHTATRADNIKCVQLLVKAGADVTIPNDEGVTPLYTALKTFKASPSERATFRHRALLPLLIHKDTINRGVNEEGITPIIIAAVNKDQHAVRWLIRNGANIHHEAEEGTALHYAALYDNNATIIKLLIEKGAQLERKSVQRRATPLGTAVMYGACANVITLIQKHGADIRTTVGTRRLHLTHVAAKNNHSKVLESLWAGGIPVDLRSTQNYHVLHVIALHNSDECIRMMYNIQLGEKKMSLPLGDNGVTPLHLLADHYQGLTLEQRDINTLRSYYRCFC